jgi:hypothetical protein
VTEDAPATPLIADHAAPAEPVEKPWPAPSPDPGWWHGTPGDETAEQPAVVDEQPPVETQAAVEAPPSGEPVRRVGKPKAPRRTKPARPPVSGLTGVLVLALLAGFFAWVSAEPLLLALGHGDRGTATVTRCTGKGIERRCIGTFDGRAYRVDRVAVAGLPEAARQAGSTVEARIASRTGRAAYAADADPWWALGIGLVLLCGLGIAWITGASRLAHRRARLGAYATSLLAPILLLGGMLILAW